MRTIFLCFFLIIQLDCFCQLPVFPFRDGDLWGVVDGNLKEMVEPSYSDMKFFIHYESDLAAAIVTDPMSGYKGLINRKGELLLEMVYTDLIYAPDENAVILYQTYPEKRYGFYSLLQKKIVTKPIYEEAPLSLHVEITSLLIVKQNGKYGVIRSDGSMVVPIQYELIKPFSVEQCPWIAAHNKDAVVYYNCKGTMQNEKPKTSFEVSEFISIGGERKMNDTPQIDMPAVTSELVTRKLGRGAVVLSQFQNGSGEQFAIVQANSKIGIIDGRGTIRVPVDYDAIRDGSPFGGLSVIKSKFVGWIDISPAKVIIEPAFNTLSNPYFTFGKVKAAFRYAVGEKPDGRKVFIELKSGKVFYPVRK